MTDAEGQVQLDEIERLAQLGYSHKTFKSFVNVVHRDLFKPGGLYYEMRRRLRQPEQKIYIALWHDRHVDPKVRAFTDKSAAIDWARDGLRDSVAHPDGLSEDTFDDEWLMTYIEEDYAWVKPSVLVRGPEISNG